MRAAHTRTRESHAAALAKERADSAADKATALAASHSLAKRLWKLVRPPSDATEPLPPLSALLADPEAVLCPVEGHPDNVDFDEQYKSMAGYTGKGPCD